MPAYTAQTADGSLIVFDRGEQCAYVVQSNGQSFSSDDAEKALQSAKALHAEGSVMKITKSELNALNSAMASVALLM